MKYATKMPIVLSWTFELASSAIIYSLKGFLQDKHGTWWLVVLGRSTNAAARCRGVTVLPYGRSEKHQTAFLGEYASSGSMLPQWTVQILAFSLRLICPPMGVYHNRSNIFWSHIFPAICIYYANYVPFDHRHGSICLYSDVCFERK